MYSTTSGFPSFVVPSEWEAQERAWERREEEERFGSVW